jgi:hypothetical protein
MGYKYAGGGINTAKGFKMNKKRGFLVMPVMVLVLVFGMTVAGCINNADKNLNGTWTYSFKTGEFVSLKMNNGNFEYLFYDTFPLGKGTYTTNGGNITIQTTHLHYSDETLLSKKELEAMYKNDGSWDDNVAGLFEKAFEKQISAYSINGLILTLGSNIFGVGGTTEEQKTFTKKY